MFRPLQDRVVVKRLEVAEEKSRGGILIPDAAKEKAQRAEVLAVGPGRMTPEGKVIAIPLKRGDIIFFGKYAGTEVEENMLVLREDEILGVFE
jgi:chaperonin GroES